MMFKTVKQLGILVSLFTVVSSAKPLPETSDNLYVSNYENVLGTSLEIKIAADDEQHAAGAEDAALKEIDRLNKILSGYDSTSEFSRWLKADKKPIAISKELFEVLSLFEKWRLKSNGAIDASAQAISRIWHEASIHNELPSTNDISVALQQVKKLHYILDEKNHTVVRLTDVPLILNSFAKSYIMDKASDAATASTGITGIVTNIGGDILVRGDHTEQVQVSDPKANAENDPPVASVNLQNKTIATSGNYRRGEMIKGNWYSHIVDPRTGQPASEVISATVIADNSTDAGALATALNVLSPAEGKQLVASVPGAEFMLITKDGKRLSSAGWEKFEKGPVTKYEEPLSLPVKDKIWDPNYEVAIQLELATIEGMRVHRPFVAVWVVDTDKKPVRQIALWYNKPKWLNEMRSWYSTYYDNFSSDNNLSSTTSATRSPGKYTLKWDGKDDKGNLVKQATYTIYIESAREHGTHQLMSKEISVNKPQHLELTGNEEISSASLDYRKKENGN